MKALKTITVYAKLTKEQHEWLIREQELTGESRAAILRLLVKKEMERRTR